MASVQSAPNLPQGGAVLPPNLNTTQINELWMVRAPESLPGQTAYRTLHPTILYSDRC